MLNKGEEISGASQAQARTVAVNAFAVISTHYLLNSRSLHGASFRTNPLQNIWVLLGIAGMIALQVAFTHVPFMNHFFHSAPVGCDSWGRVFAVGVVAHLIVEIEK